MLDVAGDGWTRTWEGADLVAWLEAAGLAVEALVPTHYVLDGPLEGVQPGIMLLRQLLEWEEQCRNHPVWRPLNRIWTVVAQKGTAPIPG